PYRVRQTPTRCARDVVPPFAQSWALHQRDLLGLVALSPWAANFPLRFPATRARRLAHDQLFRLAGPECHCVILSTLLRNCLSPCAARPIWRTRNHAVALDQRSQGVSSSRGFHRGVGYARKRLTRYRP